MTTTKSTLADYQALLVAGKLAGFEGPDGKQFFLPGGSPEQVSAQAAANAAMGLPPIISRVPPIALFGDSISYKNNNGLPWLYDSGYFTWMGAFGGYDFSNVLNFGVAGDTSAGGLARINDVTTSGATVAFVEFGVNDLYVPVSLSAYMANMTAIFTALRDANMYVICLAVTPGTNDAAVASRISDYNNALRDYWSVNLTNGVFVDTFAKTAETTVANSVWKANFATDSVHPTNLGAFNMGLAGNNISSAVLPRRTLVTSTNDTKSINSASKNAVINPLFLGTTGGKTTVTGTVASSWNASVSGGAGGVASIVAPLDGVGNAQQIVWTAAANNDFGVFKTNNLSPYMTPGNKYEAEIKIGVTNATNLGAIWLVMSSQYAHTITNTSAVASGSLVIPISSAANLYLGQRISYGNTSAQTEYRTITGINGLVISVDKPVTGISSGVTITANTLGQWGYPNTDFAMQALPSAFVITPATLPTVYAPNSSSLLCELTVLAQFRGAGGATFTYERCSLRDLGTV